VTRIDCEALPIWVRRAPRLVALVGCSADKLDRPARAADLYTGQLYRATRRWAEAHADEWGILSALYGAVPPTQQLRPYDLALAARPADERRAWAQHTRTSIDNHWLAVEGQPHSDDLRLTTVFVVLAGKPYRAAMTCRTQPYDRLLWWCPWEDADRPMGIGQQLAWLARHTNPEGDRLPTGRGGHRGPRIRDNSWRHISASVPAALFDRINRAVPERQRNAFVRRALEREIALLEDARLTALEGSDDAGAYTPQEESAHAAASQRVGEIRPSGTGGP
jgi:hypothetical protein